jgi:hypothetical protein
VGVAGGSAWGISPAGQGHLFMARQGVRRDDPQLSVGNPLWHLNQGGWTPYLLPDGPYLLDINHTHVAFKPRGMDDYDYVVVLAVHR